MISQKEIKAVLAYYATTGEFFWVNPPKNHCAEARREQ